MRTPCAGVVFALIASLVPAVPAQSSRDQPWGELQSKNPPGLPFSIRLLEPLEYRQGELIRMEVRFPGQALGPGEPPRERWQFAGFLLDPQLDCGSLQKPCPVPAGYPHKFDPLLGLGGRSDPIAVALNTYLPALAPGHYRVAALARKLVLTGRAPLSATYGYAVPPQYAVSNAVEFEVAPASTAWILETIASSMTTLQGLLPRTSKTYEEPRTAAQRLRFLDHPAAWQASLDLLPIEEGLLLRGLSATRHPARVCELMESRIRAPGQSVSSHYLSVMAQLCEPAHRSTVMIKAAAALAASLPQKQPQPKGAAFATLLEYLRQLRASEPRQPAPAWIPVLTREFVASLLGLEVWRQPHLIELAAATLDAPALVPLLESVLEAWKPGNYYEAPRAALRALHLADPARAQARILAELRRPQTWLDTTLLDLLPASAAPLMDDALIEALAGAQRPGGWDPRLRMTAVAKYATPRARSRIGAIYESQQQSCQPELMAYFVRVDPGYADRVFHSHSWDLQEAPPPCTVQYFERTPPLAMHPVLEKYMVAYLMHRDVFVKTTAARSLGRYGSRTVLAPLWDTLRYFHEYWKDNRAALARNHEGVVLEVELRNAIARGRNWRATEADLRTIESLCISERCLYETQQDLRALLQPLRNEMSMPSPKAPPRH